MKLKFTVIIAAAALCVLTQSCQYLDPAGDTLKYKRIIINDSVQDSQVQITPLEGRYVMIVLIEEVEKFSSLDGSDIISQPYSVGRVIDGKIDVKLSKGLSYWDGEGSYWVVMLLPSPSARSVSYGYLSKARHYIGEKINHLANDSFMPPVELGLDVSDFLPF